MPEKKRLPLCLSTYSITICCFVALLLTCESVRADFYKWVDEKGVVHFSDKPPEQSDSDLEVESRPDAPPSTYQPPEKPKPAAEDSSAGSQPKPSAETVKKPPKVELFVTSWCKYCKQAEAFLKKNNIAYTAYDVEKDPQAAARRRTISQRSVVPLAVINDYVILGFSESSYMKALKAGQ